MTALHSTEITRSARFDSDSVGADLQLLTASGQCADEQHAWGPRIEITDGRSTLVSRTCAHCQLDELAPVEELYALSTAC